MDVRLESSGQGDEAGVNYTFGKEEDLIRTDELIIKNLKTNKVLQITQEIGKVPVLSFGNSGGDSAMHKVDAVKIALEGLAHRSGKMTC